MMPRAMIADVRVTTGARKDGKGTWTRYAVKDGNGDFSATFDKATGEFLLASKGQYVDLEITEGERGRDIVAARPWKEPGAAANGDGDRNRSIQRQVALKTAVDWCIAIAPQKPGQATTPLDVIGVANDFARWLAEDDAAEDGPPAFDPDEV